MSIGLRLQPESVLRDGFGFCGDYKSPLIPSYLVICLTLMLLLYFFILLGASAKVSNLELYGEAGIAFLSCAYLNSQYLFCQIPSDYACYCSNENARASVVGCLAQNDTLPRDLASYYSKYCEKYYEVKVSYEQLESSLDYYLSSATYPALSNPNFNMTADNMTTPLLVNETAKELYRKSYEVFLGNYDHSIYYGIGAVSYWFLVFIVAAVANWSVVLFPGLRGYFDGKFSRAWRKHITMPALVTRKRLTQQDFLGGFLSFLIPSRLESVLLFVFFWLVFALMVVEIRYIPHDPLFRTKKEAITRFVADRTGIIATIMVPLLVLFGGRNNFLQWLTRWDFATFIVYHRWIARLMVAMAFTHGVCFSAIYVWDGIYAEEMAEEYVTWGIVAIACGGIICFQGLLFLRRAYYEVFLVLHIILAVFFVAGLWKHISVLSYPQLVYPIFAIWGFDRLVRVFRIFIFGFTLAKVELISEDALKVTVSKPRHWKSIPGGHSWLHFGLSWYFWQSHPFTFVEVPSESGSDIIFYCKVKGGVTKSLGKKLAKVPGRALSMRVAVEGPYGETSPVQRHSSVTYIAGGNGIPGIFAETLELARNAAKRQTQNQKIKLVWIIRELRSIAWFHEELKLLQHLPVETTIYITRPERQDACEDLADVLQKYTQIDQSSKDSSDKKDEKELKSEADIEKSDLFACLRQSLSHIKILEGRPSISKVIEESIDEATGSTAFVTCGHPAMVDDVRYLALKAIYSTEKRVDFYDQLQVWA